MSGYTLKATSSIIFVLTAACSAGSDSSMHQSVVVEDYCNRLDDCHFIPVGNSVADCTQEYDKYLDGLTENERADYETGLKGCLALKSCSAFGDC